MEKEKINNELLTKDLKRTRSGSQQHFRIAELLKTAKPILFNTQMVKAILDGRKTQFREALKGQFKKQETDYLGRWEYRLQISKTAGVSFLNYRYEELIEVLINDYAKYNVGDVLCVMEELNVHINDEDEIIYDSDIVNSGMASNYRLFASAEDMPQEYARIFLRVTNVRVEKFEDASFEDILAEGILKDYPCDEDGLALWEWLELQAYPEIDMDNYVFVYELERVEA